MSSAVPWDFKGNWRFNGRLPLNGIKWENNRIIKHDRLENPLQMEVFMRKSREDIGLSSVNGGL